MDLGLAILKNDVRIRISILDIPCVPIFSQNEQFYPKIDSGLETEKSNVGIKISIVETLCVSIFSQTGQLFGLNL